MKKYQFTDAEYKEFVEALGGKKKPLDVENAKIVRITYDAISARSSLSWLSSTRWQRTYQSKRTSR